MLLDGEAEALARKAVELALGGDPTALRLCLDRIVMPRRERAVQLMLPEVRDAADMEWLAWGVAATGGTVRALQQPSDTALVNVSRPPRPFFSPRLPPGPIAPPHERVKLGTSFIMSDKSDLLLAKGPAFASSY